MSPHDDHFESITYVSSHEGRARVVTVVWGPSGAFLGLGSVEGIDWIRGRHAEDSEEARALLATYAIVRGR